jgi:hypothetical protein
MSSSTPTKSYLPVEIRLVIISYLIPAIAAAYKKSFNTYNTWLKHFKPTIFQDDIHLSRNNNFELRAFRIPIAQHRARLLGVTLLMSGMENEVRRLWNEAMVTWLGI